MIDPKNIRNFCIIAHIDHGKSTLADRLLEVTGVVEKRKMRDRFLDRLDLEREKGITIKLKAVRLPYHAKNGQEYIFNLIDTPGHVDFSYEVSRSLATCEGALLLVDAVQGIQAQTVANAYKAIDQGLKLIPVVNKIDAPEAEPERVAGELINRLGFLRDELLYTSGRTGEGVPGLLEAIVERLPPPRMGDYRSKKVLQALIFDSFYDQHRGVVAFVRLFSGNIRAGDQVEFLATASLGTAIEVGVVRSDLQPVGVLSSGDVGYLITGLKDLQKVTVGDTVASPGQKIEPLPGYSPAKPMVFAGFYPTDQDDFKNLADALEKFRLQDAALSFARESSLGLGRGFRCGFLGTLHLEVVKERLEREYNLEILVTAPSVRYQVVQMKSSVRNVEHTSEITVTIERPQDLSDQFSQILEPWVAGEILVPPEYLGEVMKFCGLSRGVLKNTVYPQNNQKVRHIKLEYDFPLAELLLGFYDGLKSSSSGYASFDYQLSDFRPVDAVRLDILVHGELIEPLSQIVLRERAPRIGRELLAKLKDILPRQQFAVKLQAVVGARVVAREDISAVRKDVTAKLYGGDRTRKDKLLNKQKKGKKKMRQFGKVNIPGDVFFKVLST